MKPLGDKEQRYAFVGAGMAAMASVALWGSQFDEQAAVALAGIGLLMAFLLFVAARSRRRLLTGLACVLLAFGPWGGGWVIGLPFLMLAAWLGLQSSRLQPVAEPEFDEHGELVGRPPRTRPPPRRRRGRAGASTETTDAAAPGAGPDRRPPPPSKRYTPPQRRR